jgi:hypothetical protein
MAMRTIGYVNITTAGTRVRVTVGETDPTARIPCHTIFFQAHPSNTGVIYVGNSAVSSSAGLFATLPIPTNNIHPTFELGLAQSPNAFNLVDFYVDASVNGDDVLVSYLTM